MTDIATLYEARVKTAQAVHHLTVMEGERIALKIRLYDEFRAGGKTQKDSEDLVRVHPDYVRKLAEIAGQEHARDLLLAECERLSLTVKLTIAERMAVAA